MIDDDVYVCTGGFLINASISNNHIIETGFIRPKPILCHIALNWMHQDPIDV